jgi:sulfate transport system substrate-binding protein
MSAKWMNFLGLTLVVVALGLLGIKNIDRRGDHGQDHLLNVSYDPTREVYAEINPGFVTKFEKDTGQRIGIEQSHGGSSRQARAVAGGLAADVVTLALPSDIEELHKLGLVADGWPSRFPHASQPYSSTIVFVVRKTNPKHIQDWPDLIAPGIEVVTPDPKTSGNGKLSVLAAWGAVIQRGGNEADAREFITKLYRNVTVLGQGARDATTTFTLGNEGDVQLTWENEALREVAEAHGELEVVRPPVSIRAEPSVALVAANVARHHSEAAADAYLSYLFTDEVQEIFARNGYRPVAERILKRHRDTLPPMELFPVTLVARDWDDAQAKFFSENGVFDAIRQAKSK